MANTDYSTALKLPLGPVLNCKTECVYEGLVTDIEHRPNQYPQSVLTVQTPYKTYEVSVELDCEDNESGLYYFDPEDEELWGGQSKEVKVSDVIDMALELDDDGDYTLLSFNKSRDTLVSHPVSLRKDSILSPFARVNPFIWHGHQFECLFEALVFSMVKPDSIHHFYNACNKVSEREDVLDTGIAAHVVFRNPEKYNVDLMTPNQNQLEMWTGLWMSLVRAMYNTNKATIDDALSSYSHKHYMYYNDPWEPSLIGGTPHRNNGMWCFKGFNVIGSLWMMLRREVV